MITIIKLKLIWYWMITLQTSQKGSTVYLVSCLYVYKFFHKDIFCSFFSLLRIAEASLWGLVTPLGVIRSLESLLLDRCHRLTPSVTHDVTFSFFNPISIVCESFWTFITGLLPNIDKTAIYDGCNGENARHQWGVLKLMWF